MAQSHRHTMIMLKKIGKNGPKDPAMKEEEDEEKDAPRVSERPSPPEVPDSPSKKNVNAPPKQETVLLDTYVPSAPMVTSSLDDMRKAYTGPNRVEIEKSRLEKSCQEQLDKFAQARLEARAKARGKRWPPKKKKAKVLTSVEETVKAVNSEHNALVNMLDAPPLLTKSFTQIKKESTASYALLVTTKYETKSSRAGIPRTLYPELIEDIVAEMTEKKKQKEIEKLERRAKRAMEREQLQKAHEEQKAAWKGRGVKEIVTTKEAQAVNTPERRTLLDEQEDFSCPLNSPEERQDMRRPTGMKKWQSQPDLKLERYDTGKSAQTDPTGISTPKNVSPARAHHSATMKTRPISRQGPSSPGKISPSKQLAKKEAIAAEREKMLLQTIYNRENAQLLKIAKIERNDREGKWLAIVATLVRIKNFKELYFKVIKPEREKRTLFLLNNRQKDAAQKIETWWSFARLGLLWSRNKKAARRLSSFFRRIWFKMRRLKCKVAVRQIKRFLLDSAGSTMVKRLYSYRTKVSKIQKWFRDWLYIQETRMQTMWLAMEKIGARRRLESLRDANAAERESVRAMWHTEGFRQPMDRMNLTAKVIKKVLIEQEKKKSSKKLAAHSDTDNDEDDSRVLREILEKKKQTHGYKGVSEATKMMLKMHGVLKEDTTGKYTKQNLVKYPTMAQRYKTWYWKTKVNPATRRKFELIRQVLSEQRKRHILTMGNFGPSLAGKKIESGKKQPKVSIAALKFFLRNDEAAANKEYEFYESENDEENKEEAKAKVVKKIRPAFLLFSKGGLKYFETVPLTFFKK